MTAFQDAQLGAAFQRPAYADGGRPTLLKLVPVEARHVLDVGCNLGGFGAALKGRQDCEVWGVEPDPNSASVAREKLDHVIVDYFRESCAIPNAYFDLVTFNDSLEHMDRPDLALLLAKRKLKPGGRIQCCVPNMRHIECLEHLLLDRDWRYEEVGIRDRTHLRFFTAVSLQRLFKELGLQVISTQFVNEDWWTPGWSWRKVLLRLFPGSTADMRYQQIVITAA